VEWDLVFRFAVGRSTGSLMRRPTTRVDGRRARESDGARRAMGQKRVLRVAGDGRARWKDGRLGWDGMRWSEMGLDENGDGGVREGGGRGERLTERLSARTQAKPSEA